MFLFLVQLYNIDANITYECTPYYGYCNDFNAVLEVYRFKDYIPVAIHKSSKGFSIKKKGERFISVFVNSLIIELAAHQDRSKKIYFDTQERKFICYNPGNNFEKGVEINNIETFIRSWYELEIAFSQKLFSVSILKNI